MVSGFLSDFIQKSQSTQRRRSMHKAARRLEAEQAQPLDGIEDDLPDYDGPDQQGNVQWPNHLIFLVWCSTNGPDPRKSRASKI
jgi:hypothetical protein